MEAYLEIVSFCFLAVYFIALSAYWILKNDSSEREEFPDSFAENQMAEYRKLSESNRAST